jgi:hypothetical protein
MPLFNSLSFVISQQFQAKSIVDDNNISLRSPVAQQMQVVNISNSDVLQTEDVLRWGYSNWGLQKVTSEYKPRETR